MSEIKPGELIVFKTHPFINDLTNVRIAAYSEYTSPLLVVKEIKEKSFDKENGRDIGQQLNCIYYNSKDGKFIDKWISSKLINKVFFSVVDHKLLSEFDFKKKLLDSNKELSIRNYENLIKEHYLNKKVILKSVDIELFKIKVNRTKENGELVETNHLEFLPPLMSVIGFKFNDEKNKFSEKTGLPMIELKCKWYNSSAKTFSESFFPSEILYSVKDVEDLFPEKDLLSDIAESIEENSFFNLPIIKPFNLEGNKNSTVINYSIGRSESIIYKHYFYQMNYFDYITQNKSVITIDNDQVFNKITENTIFGKKYPDYINGFRLKIIDCAFSIDSYYLIIYKDAYKNITKRIVKILELYIYVKDFKAFKDTYKNLSSWTLDKNPSFINYNYHNDGNIFIHLEGEIIPSNTLPKTVFEDPNVEIILKTNCLLRKGKIRNFKINSILEVQEIIDGKTLFEEDLF
ncbi:hypothetical protein [Flavobacterium pectinovorum]|uniref:Uncharacterized protein n=1 Tax=Flavobacterium pectinovorum TaxID=29533 RepID=A0AB36P011_9FLAO|nr:hypothetical protein [Flavobacterium pectinovorum]OXB04430.1 hypothetical protein B0A72_13120 [Flavobacterium pectinovorum]SHL58067.1 hypothetical protein SAMN05444387_0976 [Flavobacterium pectinovorum]